MIVPFDLLSYTLSLPFRRPRIARIPSWLRMAPTAGCHDISPPLILLQLPYTPRLPASHDLVTCENITTTTSLGRHIPSPIPTHPLAHWTFFPSYAPHALDLPRLTNASRLIGDTIAWAIPAVAHILLLLHAMPFPITGLWYSQWSHPYSRLDVSGIAASLPTSSWLINTLILQHPAM